ncbi:MAG: hypothetical protein ACI91O_000840 [Candidatus Poriferisodalaceae bacterium]
MGKLGLSGGAGLARTSGSVMGTACGVADGIAPLVVASPSDLVDQVAWIGANQGFVCAVTEHPTVSDIASRRLTLANLCEDIVPLNARPDDMISALRELRHRPPRRPLLVISDDRHRATALQNELFSRNLSAELLDPGSAVMHQLGRRGASSIVLIGPIAGREAAQFCSALRTDRIGRACIVVILTPPTDRLDAGAAHAARADLVFDPGMDLDALSHRLRWATERIREMPSTLDVAPRHRVLDPNGTSSAVARALESARRYGWMWQDLASAESSSRRR